MRSSQSHGVAIRSSEKDQLIAELRQQLYDLRNQDRDYRGVNDEIFNMEGRYRMLADDRARCEHEHRNRLNHSADEICEARKQLEDLKFLLADKSKQGVDLAEEAARARRVLDEKTFEAARLRDESVAKGDQNADLRAQLQQLERDVEAVKVQRAEMWREITHLKDLADQKTHDAHAQQDQQKHLDAELARTQMRSDDTARLVDARTADLRTKQAALEDCERELQRVRDLNNKLNGENGNLRADNERTGAENYDLRKNVDFQNGRNADMASQIKCTDGKLKEAEDALFVTRKDVDNQRCIGSSAQAQNNDLSGELCALEKHGQVLQGQNNDLTCELDRFCQTDEVLRRQLDRRDRVQGLASTNCEQMRASMYRVEEARSRSPCRSPIRRY